MIEIQELSKAYDDTVVLDVADLRIEAGESLGLVGNNGAGKTTLFRLVLDLIRADGGQVVSRGSGVRQSEHWKSYTGSYLDESFLIGFLTPDEYFQFLASMHGHGPADLATRLAKYEEFFAGEVLGRVKFIRQLSQGNQTKVGIAAALMFDPAVVVLDEPFAHLDPSSTNRLKRLLQDVKSSGDVTLLISSHNLSHVTDVCDRTVLVEKGKVIHDTETGAHTLAELERYFAA